MELEGESEKCSNKGGEKNFNHSEELEPRTPI
jgi:hypothetical protein